MEKIKFNFNKNKGTNKIILFKNDISNCYKMIELLEKVEMSILWKTLLNFVKIIISA